MKKQYWRDEGRQEGIALGMEKGMEKGREERDIHFTQKLLQEGLPYDMIERVTGLSLENIERLKQNMTA